MNQPGLSLPATEPFAQVLASTYYIPRRTHEKPQTGRTHSAQIRETQCDVVTGFLCRGALLGDFESGKKAVRVDPTTPTSQRDVFVPVRTEMRINRFS